MKTLHEVMMDAPILTKVRASHSRTDYGDDKTVTKRVKRIGVKEYNDHDFGVFLGRQDGTYYIGTCEILSFIPSRVEAFPALDDMLNKWELD